MGGGGTEVYQPQTPAPPTVGQSMADYTANLPQLYETQLQYMPQFAELAKGISEQLYPETAGLQENLAQQAREGMVSEVPDWMKSEYLSNMRSQLGENAMSRTGADYLSRGLLQQKQDWQSYYRSLAQAASGQQALVQAPSYESMYGGYSPSSVMNYNMQGYGAYSQANRPFAYQQGGMGAMQGIMGGMSSLGSLAGGIGALAAFSSRRFKKNIVIWQPHLN